MRIKKIWITICLVCCGLLCLAACNVGSDVQSIALNDYSAESPLEIKMGKFSYGDYTLFVTNERGDTREIPLTEDMISETDKLKFFQEGNSEITITYKGVSTTVPLRVSRNRFSENVQLKDVTATYTGKSFTVEVEGDIPSGTKVLYPQGNTFQGAGSYDMTAVLQCDGYETKTLSARVVVEKATYDLSNALLYNKTVTYNKDAHSLAVKGAVIEETDGKVLHAPASLPKGVSVRYSIVKVTDGGGVEIPLNKQQSIDGNKAIDAGTYKVVAKYRGDETNYHTIPDSIAYLTIERAAYDTSKVVFANKTVTYSGEEYALSIAADSKLFTDVEVSYQIMQLKDGAGNSVPSEYKTGNSAKDAGMYSVKAIFTVVGKNADNYTCAPYEKTAFLTISRATYDEALKGAYLDAQWYELEVGKAYEIYFDCELPEGVSPIFALTDENGEEIDGRMELVITEQGKTTKTTYKYVFTAERAGEYTCVLTFVHANKNYEEITLRIETWIFIGDAT